jgi:hypothetical protein
MIIHTRYVHTNCEHEKSPIPKSTCYHSIRTQNVCCVGLAYRTRLISIWLRTLSECVPRILYLLFCLLTWTLHMTIAVVTLGLGGCVLLNFWHSISLSNALWFRKPFSQAKLVTSRLLHKWCAWSSDSLVGSFLFLIDVTFVSRYSFYRIIWPLSTGAAIALIISCTVLPSATLTISSFERSDIIDCFDHFMHCAPIGDLNHLKIWTGLISFAELLRVSCKSQIAANRTRPGGAPSGKDVLRCSFRFDRDGCRYFCLIVFPFLWQVCT